LLLFTYFWQYTIPLVLMSNALVNFVNNNAILPERVTRNSSEDAIAEVNFLYDIVHALQNTIDSCINSATDRCCYVLERRFTKFSEITQCNRHYAVHGHSPSTILVPIESLYMTFY